MQLRIFLIGALFGIFTLSQPLSGEEFVEVLESNEQRTLIKVKFPDVEIQDLSVEGKIYQVLKLNRGSFTHEPGLPQIPFLAVTIAIPPLSGVDVKVIESEHSTLNGITVHPYQPDLESFLIDEEFYTTDSFYPAEIAHPGEPAILRDYRVIPLYLYPLSYNPSSGLLHVYHTATIEIRYQGVGLTNPKYAPQKRSPSFEPLYRRTILNHQLLPRSYAPLQGEGARYIIITHDNYYDAILPLAEWKNKKGMKTEVAKLSEIGSSASEIKAYIQNAYDNWDIPPEYVLLVGDTEYLPAYYGSDNYYATLDGGDIFADVYVGRFSVDNVTQCSTMVSKTLGYERTPYMDELDWFKSGCLIVRDDYGSGDSVYYNCTWDIYNWMELRGFVQIDTLFRRNGADDSDVEAAVTDGRTYVNFRGQGVSNWWSPFSVDPNQTNNGFKLPIVLSATCGTGTFSSDSYICEPWIRAGTPQNPRGAVGFYGSSTICSGLQCAQKRSAVSRAFFREAVHNACPTYGMAANQAKYEMYLYFNDADEYEGWNVLGDPELNLWIATPETLQVVHDPTVPLGPSEFQVIVSANGLPATVWVCVMMDTTVYEWGETDASGRIVFSITPVNLDTLWVTVTNSTRGDFLPYEGYAVVITAGPYVTYDSCFIDDSAGGNGDTLANPGETIELWVALENTGADSAFQVSGILRTEEPSVTLVDSVQSYGDIPPGGVTLPYAPYSFEISTDCSNLDSLDFSLFIQDTSGNDWTAIIPPVVVHRAELVYLYYTVDDSPPGGDGNGELDGGESAYLVVTLLDNSLGGLTDVEGILGSEDPHLEISDSLGDFGDISPGDTGSNELDPFYITADSNTPHGYYAEVHLAMTGNGFTYTYMDTLVFSIGISPLKSTDPTGPDAYGYYAYDDTDTLAGHAPSYEWFEIAPPGPGSIISAITDQDAATTTLDLPFTFKYYNTNYDEVSVCSNGFLAMGTTAYRHGDNSAIPNTHGPDAMVAPFWDDLDPSPSGGGDIYQYYDTINHRWIVEFKGVAHYGAPSQQETFQAILYDPSYYPTPTGDGEIVFLYNQVSNIGSNTIGIENPNQIIGIQYLYNGVHDTTSSPPVAGRAIKFTTSTPGVVESPSITLQEFFIDDSTYGNGDGIADAGETIELWMNLLNDGDLDGNGVVGKLRSSDPDISILDSIADFGDLAAGGGTGSNESNPYILQVTVAPQDSFIDFQLVITANGGNYETVDSFTLQLGSLVPRLPEIAIENHSISDSTGGNGDGIADAGETVEIQFTLINSGEANANGVEGRLRSSDPDVSMLDSIAQFGNLPAEGGTGNNGSNPYLFQVSTEPQDSFAQFELWVTANAGIYDTILDFTLHLGALVPPAPDIVIYNYSIVDTIVGNGNGIPDPGETVHMIFNLLNNGNLDATDVSGILHSADPDVILIDSLGSFGDISGWGGSGNNETDPYTFEITPAPEDTLLSFVVDIEANGGEYTTNPVLTIPIGSMPFRQFSRADADADNIVTIGDAIYVLKWLFVPDNPPPPCMDAADADDDGTLSMTDGLYILQHLFLPGSPEPPLPFPNCGPDPTNDELGCDSHPCMGPVTNSKTFIENRLE